MISRIIIHSTFIISFVLLIITNVGCTNLWKNGYFINNTGDTTHCLIKDENWKNNPEQFKWRRSLNDDTRIASIEFISSFMIDSTALYIRDTLQFETSPSKLEKLSDKSETEFESKVIFLKVLVQGKASLYYYEKEDAQLYFYTGPNQPTAEPLIYKRDIEGENKQGIKSIDQVRKEFECEEFRQQEANDLENGRKTIVNAFVQLNKCLNSDFINFNTFETKGDLNISTFLAAYSTPTNIVRPDGRSFSYGPNFPWQVGLELEYLFPFWNRSFSIFLAPSIFRFGKNIYRNAYLSINMQLAARKYLTIFSSETIYLSAGLTMFYPIKSNFSLSGNTFELPTSTNPSLGIGYEIADRLNAELQFGIDHNFTLQNSNTWRIESNYYGLLLKIKLF